MELKIDQEKNIAYIKLAGSISSKDILDAFHRAVSDEQYGKGMGRLWDFTKVDLSALDLGIIPEMAKHSLLYPPGICDVKVAFVVLKAHEYGLTRMFEAYSDLYAKSKVFIFYSIEEAEEWLMR